MAKYQVRTFYTSTIAARVFTHQVNMFMNVAGDPDPGADPTAVSVTLKGGGSAQFDTAYNTWLNLWRPVVHTTTDIIRAEIWRAADPDSQDYTYITTLALGVLGTAVVAVQSAQQNTITFRSVTGKSARMQLMESSLAGVNKEAFPTSNATINTLAAHIVGATSPFVTRHGDYLVVPIHLANGQNERLAYRRNRE